MQITDNNHMMHIPKSDNRIMQMRILLITAFTFLPLAKAASVLL
jgi:hypothetical protein